MAVSESKSSASKSSSSKSSPIPAPFRSQVSSQGSPARPPGGAVVARVYRLVDRQGNPHPVLDDLYDTLDAAWSEAQAWWAEHCCSGEPVEIGVEVSTSCGSWRTLRHPAV